MSLLQSPFVLRLQNSRYFVGSTDKPLSKSQELLKPDPKNSWIITNPPINVHRLFPILNKEYNIDFLTLYYMKRFNPNSTRNSENFKDLILSPTQIRQIHSTIYSYQFENKEKQFERDMIELYGIYP
jgi:hypothetical protein